MPNNWIITQDSLTLIDKDGSTAVRDGDPINLDFLAKVQWGGDFYKITHSNNNISDVTAPTAEQQRQLTFFHGISNNTGSKGSTTTYKFKSPNQALAAKKRVESILVQLGIAQDLRVSLVTINSCSLATIAGGTANVSIVLAGNNFSADGIVKFADSTSGDNFGEMSGTVSTDKTLFTFTLDTTIPGGTYDIEYTDSNGNYAVLPAAITLVRISPLTAPSGVVGTSYSQAFTASGGTSPYTWTAANFSIPGLNFTANTATISGTPTTAGSYSFALLVTDSNNHVVTMNYTITITT